MLGFLYIIYVIQYLCVDIYIRMIVGLQFICSHSVHIYSIGYESLIDIGKCTFHIVSGKDIPIFLAILDISMSAPK